MRYYTKNSTTKRLILQPNYITTAAGTTVNPSAAQWAAIGAYPRADDPAPTPPEGKVAMLDDYEVRDGAWHALWRFEDAPPPPPRRWTRLAIKTALAQAGMLAAARQFLSATEIAQGYTAWEALTDCDYIEEGYGGAEAWSALLDGAAQALGKTREEIDAFLAQIPQEGGV